MFVLCKGILCEYAAIHCIFKRTATLLSKQGIENMMEGNTRGYIDCMCLPVILLRGLKHSQMIYYDVTDDLVLPFFSFIFGNHRYGSLLVP